MPLYNFYCPFCKHKQSIISSMQDRRNHKKEYCEKCNKELERDFRGMNFGIGNKEYFHPIHSDSLAIMPSQVEDHKQMFPNVRLDSECRPIFTSVKQHDDYINKVGVTKEPQKIKPKGKRIA